MIALPNTQKVVYAVTTCSLHNTKSFVSSHWQENTILSNLNEVDSHAKTNFEEDFFQTLVQAENGFNPVKFWLSTLIASQFPVLSRLANGIFSIPASSASRERTFSLAGNSVTKKRSQLSSSTVDALMVVNSGLHFDQFELWSVLVFKLLVSNSHQNV